MGRRRKQVTYDSKETKTVLGLLSILLAITLAISLFAEGGNQSLFVEIRRVFGQTTFMAAIFFFNFGVSLFGSNWPFASRSSVLAQFLLMFLIPAFLTSFSRSKLDAQLAVAQGLSGGELGYFLAYRVFNDALVFAQYTWIILGLAVCIFVPIAFAVPVSRIIELIEIAAGWLISAIRNLFSLRLPHRDEDDETVMNTKKLPQASHFGDFNRSETKPKKEKKRDDREDESEETVADIGRKSKSGVDVQIAETDIGESGLSFASLNYPNWKLPPVSLLTPFRRSKPSDADTERNAAIIERTLQSFDIDAKVVESYIGPSVVRYALNIPLGVKVSKIENSAQNIALGLGVDSQAVRIESIPGTTYLGVEVPRVQRDMVRIRELMESEEMQKTMHKGLPVPVGKDIDGTAVVANAQRMPHLLIAGATGSGKSILTNAFIMSLLMNKTPDELKLILVDPKRVELSDYNGIPHLLTPVITDMGKVVNALKWAVKEMDRRYEIMESVPGTRNIEAYNEKLGFAAMPYIVIVIDEMADMMMTSNRVEAETAIVRLAQKARAVGIHLILATQRPSVNVITGIIKANVPARIGMRVSSGVDSRVIIDSIGSESLMGNGDLLYKPADNPKASRLQAPYVSAEEVSRVVNFIKDQAPNVTYITSIVEDPPTADAPEDGDALSADDLMTQAIRIVVNYQKGSSSFLQRRLNIGFNKAARLLEDMEEAGIVAPAVGAKPREVLVSDPEEAIRMMQGGDEEEE